LGFVHQPNLRIFYIKLTIRKTSIFGCLPPLQRSRARHFLAGKGGKLSEVSQKDLLKRAEFLTAAAKK
jgi:hypothetical protein